MVAINPLTRQPTNIDFARTTQFKFSLLKIPNVEDFTTTANIPGISFTGDADVNTPFKSIAMIGDTLDFAVTVAFSIVKDICAKWLPAASPRLSADAVAIPAPVVDA